MHTTCIYAFPGIIFLVLLFLVSMRKGINFPGLNRVGTNILTWLMGRGRGPGMAHGVI